MATIPAFPPAQTEEPKIIMPEYGYHNRDLEAAAARLNREQTYRDLSTIIITPTRSNTHGLCARIVSNWMGLMKPMNQQVAGPMFITGREVGDAYNIAINMIINHPIFSNWKYVCTLEDDVIVPPDGLLKLYESIEGGVDGNKYDVVQGIYWTKGLGGQPMIYGEVGAVPKNFRPQIPIPNTVQPCAGLGMGFNLYRMEMFKDKRFQQPLFKTLQDWDPHVGGKAYTQDLYFYEAAGALNYKFACDTRVKCGHYDKNTDTVW